MQKPSKIINLIEKVQECVRQGRYLDTTHSIERQRERIITRLEMVHVLLNGFYEKSKDKYEDRFKAWNYAIRGKTVDQRELRIIVSFDENNLLIITAIALERDG